MVVIFVVEAVIIWFVIAGIVVMFWTDIVVGDAVVPWRCVISCSKGKYRYTLNNEDKSENKKN